MRSPFENCCTADAFLIYNCLSYLEQASFVNQRGQANHNFHRLALLLTFVAMTKVRHQSHFVAMQKRNNHIITQCLIYNALTALRHDPNTGTLIASAIGLVMKEPSQSNNQQMVTQISNLKAQDPSAGFVFSLMGVGIYCFEQLTSYGLKLDNDSPLQSIYHVANQFIYPLGYFIGENISGSNKDQAMLDNLNAFYQQWKDTYGGNTTVADNLISQHSYLKAQLHQDNGISAFEAMDQLFNIVTDLQHGKNNQTFEQALSAVKDNLNWFDSTLISIFKSMLTGSVTDILKDNAIVNRLQKYITFDGEHIATTKQEQSHLTLFDLFVTVIFTVLTTTKASPAPAMGYSGVETKSDFYIANLGKKLFQSAQIVELDKLPADKRDIYPVTEINKVKYAMLCVDHSAMLFPSDEMMEWVYRRYLFGRDGKEGAFSFFGKYDLEKVKSDNTPDEQNNEGSY